MQNLQEAKAGLKKLFIAQIGAVICSVLGQLPVISLVAGLAAWVFIVLTLLGFWQAGKDIEGCKTAFTLTIVNLVVSLLSVIFSKSVLFGTILSLAITVINLAVTYFVCTSVSDVMTKNGSADVAKLGHTVWIINLVCALVTVVLVLLAFIPLLGAVLAAVGGILTAIASLVGGVLYIIFLYKSSQAL